ncbi:MAG TPA: sigma-70 family RNA polymerase sigma factor [Gemmatimonadales bacterium]|nr:sigma-70 family RNA polymerase sigma factor [Gemmatimonadales bacterium]
MPLPAVPSDPAADADLVRAWRGGDERGATQLVERHVQPVARFLAAAGAEPGEVEDLVQETFLRAFRAIENWRGDATFRSWLFTIASNLLRDAYRRRKGKTMVPLEEQPLAAHDDPGAQFDGTEAEERLQAGLEQLPRLQREVFLLRAQQGMDYDSIAATLSTTPGSARVHYHHAVKKLKELIA